MIPADVAMHAARSMGAIPFFPADEDAQTAIANEIMAFCATVDQARWLVAKMIRTYTTWPGPREMRAAFCSKFRPQDGFEVGSAVYSDGVPTDRDQGAAQITGPDLLSLPAPPARSEPVSENPELAKVVHAVASAMPRMPEARWSNDDPVSKKLIDMGFDPL
jgi:hypothetical protein